MVDSEECFVKKEPKYYVISQHPSLPWVSVAATRNNEYYYYYYEGGCCFPYQYDGTNPEDLCLET
jgi:hypothetical protein